MRALVHGYFGMGNVGDEAILSVLIDELRSRGIEPIILSSNPKRSTLLHGVLSCPNKLLSLGFWKNFLGSSMLIFSGGGRYGKRTMRRMCMLAILAKALRKRVEFRALGIYPYEWVGLPIIANSPEPFGDLFTRALIKTAFTLADRVSVRDEFSKHILASSGVAKEVGLKEDLAFELKPSSRERSLQILSKHGVSVGNRPLVGVNLRTLHPEVRWKLVDVVSNSLDWLIARGAEVVFVPFGYGSTPKRFFDNDLIIAGELKKCMKNRDSFKVIDNEYRPQEILGIFRFFDLFIGMRFHSIVFSMIMRVPTVALIYDTKTVELLKERRGWCYCIPILINELDANKLKKAVDAITE